MKIQGTGAVAPQFLKMFIGGKNTVRFAASFESPFFITADDNRLVPIQKRDLPYALVESLDDLVALKLALTGTEEERKERLGVDVATVILDNLGGINAMLMAERLRKERRDHMTGPDWGWLGERMREILGGFRNLPLHVIFASSLKQTEDQDSGRRIIRPGVSGMADEVADYAHIALLLKESYTSEVKAEEEVVALGKKVLKTWALPVADSSHEWPHDDFGLLPKDGFEIDGEKDFEFIRDTIFPSGPRQAKTTYEVFFAKRPEGYEFSLTPLDSPTDSAEQDVPGEGKKEETSSLPPIGLADGDKVFKCDGPLVNRGKGEGTCGAVYDSQDQYEASKIKWQVSLCLDCSVKAGKPKNR